MDVSDHTVVPPASDQLRCPFVQQPGDLTGKVRFAACVVGKDVEDGEEREDSEESPGVLRRAA